MAQICIIGAGISGLALAWQHRQLGENCTLLETAPRAGGAIQSTREGDYLAESGPNSLQVSSFEIEEFLQSIPGLASRMLEAAPAAKKRFIIRNGKPQPVPVGPLSALTTPLWSFAGKLRVLKEPFISAAAPETSQSVADFVRRRLGEELYQYAINPLVGGIYAGDPELLSLRYAFPKLYALEQSHGGLVRGALAKMRESRKSGAPRFRKRILSFQDGMAELPARLAEALGRDLHTGVSIERIQRIESGKWDICWKEADGYSRQSEFDQVVVTLPAHRLDRLPVPPRLRDALAPLADIDYPPVSTLSLAFKRRDVAHPLDGFGALVPECEHRKILGVLFSSSVFARRAPEDEVLLTVFVGGERQPELATSETAALLERVLPELRSLLGVRGQPTFTHHTHWPKSIPQYKTNHGEYLAIMKTIEADYPGLRLAGNYRTGISLTSCLEAALSEVKGEPQTILPPRNDP